MKTFVVAAIVHASQQSLRSTPQTIFASDRSLSEQIYRVADDCYIAWQDGDRKMHDGPFSAEYAKTYLDDRLGGINDTKFVLCMAESNHGFTTMYDTAPDPERENVLKAWLEPNFVSDGFQVQTQWDNAHWNDYTYIFAMADYLYKYKFGHYGPATESPSENCYAVSEMQGFHWRGPMRADQAWDTLELNTTKGGWGVARMVICAAASNPGKLTLQQEIGHDGQFTSPMKVKEYWMSPSAVTNGVTTQDKWGDFRRWWSSYHTYDKVAEILYNSLNAAWRFDPEALNQNAQDEITV